MHTENLTFVRIVNCSLNVHENVCLHVFLYHSITKTTPALDDQLKKFKLHLCRYVIIHYCYYLPSTYIIILSIQLNVNLITEKCSRYNKDMFKVYKILTIYLCLKIFNLS